MRRRGERSVLDKRGSQEKKCFREENYLGEKKCLRQEKDLRKKKSLRQEKDLGKKKSLRLESGENKKSLHFYALRYIMN